MLSCCLLSSSHPLLLKDKPHTLFILIRLRSKHKIRAQLIMVLIVHFVWQHRCYCCLFWSYFCQNSCSARVHCSIINCAMETIDCCHINQSITLTKAVNCPTAFGCPSQLRFWLEISQWPVQTTKYRTCFYMISQKGGIKCRLKVCKSKHTFDQMQCQVTFPKILGFIHLSGIKEQQDNLI